MKFFSDHRQRLMSLTVGLVAGLFLLSSCGGRESSADDKQLTETGTGSAETNTAETTTEAPATSVSLSAKTEGKDMREESYADLSNEPLSWWYRIPDPLGQGAPAGIDPGTADLLSRNDGMWQVPAGHKKVYITMDAGYEIEGAAPTLMAAAKEKNFKINFFLTKDYVEKNPELVKQMKAEGHVLCNHSDKHLNGPKLLADAGVAGLVADVEPMNEALRNLIGEDAAPFFRPPEGGYSERSLAVLRDLGYHPVFWSFAYRDWIADEQMPEEEAIQKIMEQLHDGSILLLHANSRTNVNIMGRLVDQIRAQGYEIGTLYEAYDLVEEAKKNPPAETEGQGVHTTAQKEAPPNSVAYELKTGDTLWQIASSHFPDAPVAEKLKEIAALNGFDDPDEMPLRSGESIYLPKE